MTTIRFQELTKRFGTTTVLDDVSFDVADGELVALLGPSGSGKSTILKLIAGIEQPSHGDILFDDQSVLPIAAHQRNAVLMFQDAYLFPFLNVADNIGFGLKTRGVARQRIKTEVARMLELVELPDMQQRFPQRLSGGQQQRVALARALVVQPRVLMLDEPLSNLDPTIRATLQQVIRRVQREFGTTTLLVTHDLTEAVAMADRVAVLIDGKIAAYETPMQLYERPPTRAAADFVGVSNIVTGTLDGDMLSTSIGAIRVAANASTPRLATWAIRPEHIQLHDAPNQLHGTICSNNYYGAFCEYIIQIQDTQLTVREPTTTIRAIGNTVGIEFPIQHLFELHDE